jgi:hypothetical protein
MRATEISGYLVRALIALLIAGIAVAPVLGEERQETDLSVFWTGDASHPLDLGALMDERDKLIENSRKGADFTGKVIGSGDPVVPDNATIVAYGFSFDKNGIPHEMIAVSQENTDVSQLLVIANQWYNDTIVSTDGAVKVSREDLPLMGSGQYYYAAEPYGLIQHNFEMYWNPCEMDPTRDYFAIQQIWAMDPGFHRYREQGSKWVNERGLSYIDWSVSTLGNTSLHDRDPFGTTIGPTTVSISLAPSLTLSWSFSRAPVTISDESDPAIQRAEWDYAFTGVDAKNTVQHWEPGSSAAVDQQRAGGRYYLAYLYAQGTFIEPTTWPNYQYVDLRTCWNTWVDLP